MDLDYQVKLIQESFETVATRKLEFASAFYANLFASYPQLKPLFKDVEIEKQGKKLHAALVLLVENLRQEDELKRILIPLGKKHTGYGALPEHYPMIGENILLTLASFNKGQWTPEHEMAWGNTIDQVTGIMLSASGATSPGGTRAPDSKGKAKSSISTWLEPELMDKVEESFARIKADKQSFTESFYERLFEQSPQLRPLFSGTNMMRQGSKLYAILVLLVENLRHPEELNECYCHWATSIAVTGQPPSTTQWSTPPYCLPWSSPWAQIGHLTLPTPGPGLAIMCSKSCLQEQTRGWLIHPPRPLTPRYQRAKLNRLRALTRTRQGGYGSDLRHIFSIASQPGFTRPPCQPS